MNKTTQWTIVEQMYLVLCNCGLPEHQIIARWTPGDGDEELYLDIHLTHWEGFWRRLWAGLRYAFGYKSRYGEFDELCLNRAEARGFAEFLNKFANDGESTTVSTSSHDEWVVAEPQP